MPKMLAGNKPVDYNNLKIELEDYPDFINEEPKSKVWIKQMMGANEFINNKKRYCLWLVNCPPNELIKMPLVLERVELCRKARLNSKDKGAQKLAETPTIFRETLNPESYIIIPCVSSERRKYVPIGFLDKNIIPVMGAMIIPNANLFHFGVLTSLMHNSWMRYVAGRLKSDFRYSKDIVYNNFPWPKDPSEKQIKNIEEKAQLVLDARDQFPESSLADLYNPLTMPAILQKAHNALDKAVDASYGKRSFKDERERIEFLFNL